MLFIVSHLYFQATVGNVTEVADRPRRAAVSDGELHFQQELQDAQNEIKVSFQTIFRLVTERKLDSLAFQR